jgi:hypothetical protein
MCDSVCGKEPASPREAYWWRKKHFENHGFYPPSGKRKRTAQTVQIPEPKQPEPVSSPAEEWQQDTLFDLPPRNYPYNH